MVILFLALSGFLVGIVTLQAPTWLLLSQHTHLWPRQFVRRYPQWQWMVWLYPLLSALCVSSVVGVVALAYTARLLSGAGTIFFAVSGPMIGYGLFNGLFELVNGVSPVVRVRAQENGRPRLSPSYIHHPTVHLVGRTEGALARSRPGLVDPGAGVEDRRIHAVPDFRPDHEAYIFRPGCGVAGPSAPVRLPCD